MKANFLTVDANFLNLQYLQDPVIRPLQEFDSSSLVDLLPMIPFWVKHPEYDRVDWLNKFILDMWPYLNKAICGVIRSTTKPIFAEYVGNFQIKSIDFESLSLGTLPPTIHGIKVYESNEKELVFEPAVRWAGNPNIVLVLKVLSLRITVQLMDLQIFAAPRITLKPFVPTFPCFARITMSLMENPHVDFGLKVHWRGCYGNPSLSGDRLSVKKSSIKMNNLNPEWNEDFKLIVKDPQSQVLELHLYDWEKVGTHDKLGMQVVPLKLLKPHETKEFTLDLLKNMNPSDPHNKKPRGKIMVEMTFDPFKEDNERFSGPLDRQVRNEVVGKASEDMSFRGGGLLLVIKKSRDPTWNEEFQFMLEEAPLKDKIHIEVISKRRGIGFLSKEPLGHVDINLIDVVYNGRVNEKYHLINSRNGVIHVEIRWNVI
ncbi:hypothetical protein F0562_016944 [Nyssa sinensis]|uniref:C2 domain-containing protein n=1 Tax=Nyssa sinensis TaxID=561372 RepID=A0A5J4ZDK0_9ASTE|nr:hypothetical protein F0562_016944 [Nyssa sinensis]